MKKLLLVSLVGYVVIFIGAFWAIQYRGFGRLSILANKPRLAMHYFFKSLKSRPNLKSVIYLISIFIPFLQKFILKK